MAQVRKPLGEISSNNKLDQNPLNDYLTLNLNRSY